MPMHDWKRVKPGIFHAFHHRWISAISDVLNLGGLPDEYYALPEPLTEGEGQATAGAGTATVLQQRPQTRFTAETDAEFYRRRKSSIAVRHVSGDRIVAMLEIVSPGNKSSEHAFRAFVEKASELLEHRIYLLIVDPFPPGPRDPNGVHAAIWSEVQDKPFAMPPDKPLTLAAYECDLTTRAYVEPFAVGDPLPPMPLFLEPNAHIQVPLEATYQTAFAVSPRRWQTVLEAPGQA